MKISRHRKCRAPKEAKLQRCLAAASAFITLRECLALCSSSHFLSEGTEVNQLTLFSPSCSPLGSAASLLPKSSHIEEMHYVGFFPCNVKSSRAHIALMSLHNATLQRRTLPRFSSQLAFRLVSTASRVLVLRGNSSKNRAAVENTSGHLIRLNQRSHGTKHSCYNVVDIFKRSAFS